MNFNNNENKYGFQQIFLNDPVGMCVITNKTGYEEIYVYDGEQKQIFLFDHEFKLIRTIGSDIKKVFYITVDSEKILYCSQQDNDNFMTLNSINNNSKDTEIFRPMQSKISEDKIYIVSNQHSKLNVDKREITSLLDNNCIQVLDKLTLMKINTIEFDDWFGPETLYLSSDSDIFTIAFEKDNNQVNYKNRFLFKIKLTNSGKYSVKKKIELTDIGEISDVLYVNNKMLVISSKETIIKIIEFKLN